jgi:hypothetical protein
MTNSLFQKEIIKCLHAQREVTNNKSSSLKLTQSWLQDLTCGRTNKHVD